jgi:hypothetical protein
MPTKTLVLPSGLTGEIRNLKAKEMSILADPANSQTLRGAKRKSAKRAHPLDPIYAGVWLKTLDAGPYTIAEGTAPQWPKVLLCDRFYLLLHVRDLTWGAYEMKVKCRTQDCPRVKKPFLWDLDLNQLEFKELPAESREKVKAGNFVFDIMVGDKACKFKLLTGEDEANLPTLADDVPTSKKLLAQVASRLFFIDGVEDDDARVDWVGELDLPDLYAASRAMDAVDGGVETRTKVVCPDCEEEFTIDVPFGDAAFLAPTPM